MTRPPVTRAGVVVPVRIARTGGHPTPAEVRSSRWRRTSQGFHVPFTVDGDVPEQRIVEASVVVPDGCAITGWAALRWRGGRWFDGTASGDGRRPVTILVGTHDIRRQDGIAVSAESVGPEMYDVVDGVPVTKPVWAASFEMRYGGSIRTATRVADLAAHDDLLSLEELEVLLCRQNGWTGIPLARAAAGLADENAWSPPEIDMRKLWVVDAGFRRPLCNAPLFDLGGRHLLTPDLFDPVAGVAGEYQGAHHLERHQYELDLRRIGLYAALDVQAVFMSASDLADPSDFLRRLDVAYQRAESRPSAHRAWTVEVPPWWVMTDTVARRRALTAHQRAVLLRHRRT